MNKPNVFLAVMDAVRPDDLSCHGYSKKTTPNIDKIAQEGVLFENPALRIKKSCQKCNR